jgi:hypothetical protein
VNRLRTSVGIVVVSTVLQLASVQMAVGSEPCGDVHVIWARGSGAQLGDSAFQNFYVRDLSSRVGSGLTVSAYQLGQGSGYGGINTPRSATRGRSPLPAATGFRTTKVSIKDGMNSRPTSRIGRPPALMRYSSWVVIRRVRR